VAVRRPLGCKDVKVCRERAKVRFEGARVDSGASGMKQDQRVTATVFVVPARPSCT
jgi:hypothetical protein